MSENTACVLVLAILVVALFGFAALQGWVDFRRDVRDFLDETGKREDGTEEYIEFSPFAWAGEHFVSAQYGYSTCEQISFNYNGKYGQRVWTDLPTDEQRAKTPWIKKEDEG